MIDLLELLYTCETTYIDDCFNYKCKYDFLCTYYKHEDFTTMIYSEGE